MPSSVFSVTRVEGDQSDLTVVRRTPGRNVTSSVTACSLFMKAVFQIVPSRAFTATRTSSRRYLVLIFEEGLNVLVVGRHLFQKAGFHPQLYGVVAHCHGKKRQRQQDERARLEDHEFDRVHGNFSTARSLRNTPLTAPLPDPAFAADAMIFPRMRSRGGDFGPRLVKSSYKVGEGK